MEWSSLVLRAGGNVSNSENSDDDAERNKNQMEVDDKPQPKKDPNDLSEYKLDEYDEDNTEQGAHWFLSLQGPFWRGHMSDSWNILQYQRPRLLSKRGGWPLRYFQRGVDFSHDDLNFFGV